MPPNMQTKWCPIDVGIMNTDGKPDVIGGIKRFTNLADQAGRGRQRDTYKPLHLGPTEDGKVRAIR